MESNKLAQVADLDSTETIINIDYLTNTLNIYSNKATVLRRMLKHGYVPTRVFKMDEEKIEGMEFEVTTKNLGKFLRTGIFKYD